MIVSYTGWEKTSIINDVTILNVGIIEIYPQTTIVKISL